MAIQHLKDGEDFGDHPSHFSKDFGFSGSAKDAQKPGMHKAAVPFTGDKDTKEPAGDGAQATTSASSPNHYAHGGHMHHPYGHQPTHSSKHAAGGMIHHHAHGGYTHVHHDGTVTHHTADGAMCHGGSAHMAKGGHHMATGGGMHHMHPHGHKVQHVEHHPHDGSYTVHHAHGGRTMHDAAGGVTHLDGRGAPVHMPHSGVEHMHDPDSELAHRSPAMAHGGAMKGGRGHAIGAPARFPRSMKPAVAHRGSPIETPPRDPSQTTTPRNQMSGGEMPYGVEPSAEPDMAGADQGPPGMSHGGHSKHRRHHGG